MNAKRHSSVFHQAERGSAQVEFAFAAATVLVLLFLGMELCSAVYTYVVLSDAANEGLRYAIIHSSDANFVSDTQNQVTTYASYSSHNVSGMTVTVNCPDSGAGCPGTIPGRVQVTVSYPYVPYVGLLSSPPVMHAYAEGRLIY